MVEQAGSGIDDFSLRGFLGARRWFGVLDMTRSHQMVDGMAGQQEMVDDDAAMTSPPDRFRAHQRQAVISAKAFQLLERVVDVAAKGLAGLVEKLRPPP